MRGSRFLELLRRSQSSPSNADAGFGVYVLMSTETAPQKRATLYRMVMDSHICPYGLKSLHLLKSEGYAVEDIWGKTRGETDAFKAEQGGKTIPQTKGQRIGGYDDRAGSWAGPWPIPRRPPTSR